MIKFIYPEENKEKQVQENAEMAGEVAQGVEEYEFKKGANDAVYFDKKFPEPVEEGQEPPQPPPTERVDEELAQIENKYKTSKVLASVFLGKKWKGEILELLSFRVMRYPQIVQSLMFLTGAMREDICLPETNKLCWKLFHEKKIPQDKIPNAMKNYQMYG